MKCPNCLYNNHEQADVCEKCGEPLVGENRLFKTCPHCGYINDKTAAFCASCDEPLDDSGLRRILGKKAAKKQRIRKQVRRQPDSEPFPWLFLFILIFIGLVLLGMLPERKTFAPADMAEPATLILLQGTQDHSIAEGSTLSDFGALAMDSAGIIQMALYADGELVDAQAFNGAVEAHYQPALSALPAGEHEIFVRATNVEGQTALSQIIAVDVGSAQGAALSISANTELPSAPLDMRANLVDDGQRISVSWDSSDETVATIRVYVRPPESAGLVHMLDLSGNARQVDFSPDRTGEWEAYVAFISEDGNEGALGYASQFFGEVAMDEAATSSQALPAPRHIQLATTTAQCQSTSAGLGPVRNLLHGACLGQLNDAGQAEFIIWRWPLTWQDGQLISDLDLTGFEVKLVLTDQNGQELGERISSIPFNDARGALRMSLALNCGTQSTWYVRAVGHEATSDWAYAGSSQGKACDQTAATGDGCSGQSDGVAYSNLPEGLQPDLLFASACDQVDQCYLEAEFGQSKAFCDGAFLDAMLATCGENAGSVDAAGCQALAQDFYHSANLTGGRYFEGEKVMDCLDAKDRLGCAWGTMPEGVHTVAERIWGGIVWSGRSAWSGVLKVGKGGAWLIDWVRTILS